jgi:hypothetical protein
MSLEVVVKEQSKLMRAVARVALALLLVVSLAAPAGAQQHGQEHQPEHEAGGHGEHEFHRHHFVVFLGITEGEVEKEAEASTRSGGEAVEVEDESAFTVGLEYEYRLNRRWGVGALVDFAGKDTRTGVVAIPAVLHVGADWKMYAGPGFEKNKEHDAEFLVRVGVLYDFHVGRFTIAPAINVDFVDDEEILVYGLNIGRGF